MYNFQPNNVKFYRIDCQNLIESLIIGLISGQIRKKYHVAIDIIPTSTRHHNYRIFNIMINTIFVLFKQYLFQNITKISILTHIHGSISKLENDIGVTSVSSRLKI